LLLTLAGINTTSAMLALGAFVCLRTRIKLAALRADPLGSTPWVEELLR